ncbi:MAG: NAD(P)/FAD-dependent oxidoreductase [Proteobacteria bacterium]|nr:NAD(P)/FAD-dependent oxidoreductase [Pseudomonadota bacterium]
MDFDTIVAGGGVVGLASARALALTGRRVIVLEAGERIGAQTSSRNSGVIHAGIYYPAGSLKARLCVAGRDLLYAYCAERGIAHRRCGKLIVATSPAETDVLRSYQASAVRNGAGELAWLGADEVAALEPAVSCVAALHSPRTGIIDASELMQALLGDLEAAGGLLALRSRVTAVSVSTAGCEVLVAGEDGGPLQAREFVNAAGLHAAEVARATRPLDRCHVPDAYYARGHYYSLSGSPPFRRLVYPIAESAGLGTHVTLDLAGRVRFGPDVEWIDGIDYRFGADRRAEFAAAIRRYYPGLDASRLAPDYTGIRPKISAPGAPAADFRIDGPARHGLPGLVNLFGIESPGLTSSLAIGEYVRELLSG